MATRTGTVGEVAALPLHRTARAWIASRGRVLAGRRCAAPLPRQACATQPEPKAGIDSRPRAMCALLPFLQGKAGQGNGQGNGRAGRRAIALWSINNGKKRIALIFIYAPEGQGENGGRPVTNLWSRPGTPTRAKPARFFSRNSMLLPERVSVAAIGSPRRGRRGASEPLQPAGRASTCTPGTRHGLVGPGGCRRARSASASCIFGRFGQMAELTS